MRDVSAMRGGHGLVSVLFVGLLITLFLLKTFSLLVCTLFLFCTKCQRGMKCVVRNAHCYVMNEMTQYRLPIVT